MKTVVPHIDVDLYILPGFVKQIMWYLMLPGMSPHLPVTV